MERNENIMPLYGRGELSAESFNLTQYDNTYLLAAPRYYQFYASYIRPRMQMYKGWINGFHNTEHGVLPSFFLQKIGGGIQNLLFSKPIVLNTENGATAQHISSKKYKKSRFPEVVKEAYGYAVNGGTGLIKINRDGNNDLRFEAVPMDRFFVEVDAYGDIERVKSYVAAYHDTIDSTQEYYLCEERFFRYVSDRGIRKRFPMIHYTFYKTSSNIVSETTPQAEINAIAWKDIPYDVRAMLTRDYGEIMLDALDSSELCDKFNRARSEGERSSVYERCKLLPFDDDLGCRLIKFTHNIPSFPKLPFGQPIAELLMNETYQYDQLKFFERVEVYIARGRVMIGDDMVNPNDPDGRSNALDPIVFTYYDNLPTGMGGPKDGAPETIQPELRADAIRAQKQNILNDTAFALNLSSSTIAAWLSDGTTQKTATEIEYERTKTDSFIAEKTELIREPLQDLVDIYFHYYGLVSPSLNIMPEFQGAKTEIIKLYSELYDKGHVTSKALAEKILGTCSVKEVNELASYIDGQKQSNTMMALQQLQAQPSVRSGQPMGNTDAN